MKNVAKTVLQKPNKLLVLIAMSAGFGLLPSLASAGIYSDSHGNVGYDTVDECQAAVLNGSAKFYRSSTTKPPLRRPGEANVRVVSLREVSNDYAIGSCDRGVGKSYNRDGVNIALQGKYIPYSPDMAVNVYTDTTGNPVRVTMKQCDNNFAGPFPRPVVRPVAPPLPMPAPVPVPVPAPVVVPQPLPEPVPQQPVARSSSIGWGWIVPAVILLGVGLALKGSGGSSNSTATVNGTGNGTTTTGGQTNGGVTGN